MLYGKEEVKVMKAEIHPNYKVTKVTCACGESFETGSVKENLRVEICSKCHPFYTGKQKFVDAGGRVDKFKKKYNL
jgi:large subunit ribosomal protein L31